MDYKLLRVYRFLIAWCRKTTVKNDKFPVDSLMVIKDFQLFRCGVINVTGANSCVIKLRDNS